MALEVQSVKTFNFRFLTKTLSICSVQKGDGSSEILGRMLAIKWVPAGLFLRNFHQAEPGGNHEDWRPQNCNFPLFRGVGGPPGVPLGAKIEIAQF